MTITIVGGGIGGLVAAVALHGAGHDVTVYEQVSEIQPLGVGINLLPHAVKVLDGLGLRAPLEAFAIPTADLSYFNRFGQAIWTEPRGLSAGYGWPQLSVHRGELHMALLRAAETTLGVSRIRRGYRLTGLEDTASGRALAIFADRSGTGHRVESDLLIAADGIHSAVRARFYPDEGPPKWNGAVLWRAVTEDWVPFLTGRSMIMAGHQDQKFVCYPISAKAHAAGRARLNWIAELRYDPATPWAREDWNRPGRIEDYLPAFESWRFDWLDVPAVIRAAARSYEFPMVDRDPLPRWTHGPVTLLGDAAHPMYPIGSNGASQAILDTDALVAALRTHGETTAALMAYEADRRPKTAAIVLANRGNGPEQVMQLAHERAPDGFADIEAIVPLAEREAIAARYKQVAGFEKDRLARPA